MEIGEDANLVSPWPNKWPAEDDAPAFKAFMNSFFDKCHNLHLQVSVEAEDQMGVCVTSRLRLTEPVCDCRLCKPLRSASACPRPSSTTSATRRPTT